ncbi:zinc finger protein 532-like [Neocloeon triangulifer]|uniref:zinc finger protein 532-like n=1 Tax=Neocloeon triangulifer TaxID=2078957 RepID=UPI00286F8D1C|nr:zinc finger protein 532-like [Neocloeon triangulifer]
MKRTNNSSNFGYTRLSRTVKRTPTRQEVLGGSPSPGGGGQVAKKKISVIKPTLSEEGIDKMVKERLYKRCGNQIPLQMPAGLNLELAPLHKCEDCGDSFVNEMTYKQHITRRTMKITVRDAGKEPEVYFNRCNFLSGMRKNGRSQQMVEKLSVKVEPLIRELSHLLHGGDLDLGELNKCSQEFYERVQSSGRLRRTKVTSGEITDHFKVRVSQPGGTAKAADKSEPYLIAPFGMKCPECESHMATRLRLKQHLDFEGPVVKICSICHLPMPNECSLKAHERLHTAAAAGNSLMCPDCGIQFLSREMLLVHIHQDCMHGFLSATFQCPQCCKLLSSSISLEAHLLNEHTVKVYKCSLCHLVESTPDDMNKHIFHNHIDSGRMSAKKVVFNNCELCPGRYIKSNDILFHIHRHAEEADSLVCYVCAPCNVYVETKDEFREHKTICKQTVSKFCIVDTSVADKPKSKQSSPDRTEEADSPKPKISKQESTPDKKLSPKSELSQRRKSDEDLPPAKKHCVRCGQPTKATKNTVCIQCRTNRVSVLSDDSPFKQRLTITQRGVAVEEIDTDAFEDAVMGKKKVDNIYNCYICKEKLVSKFGDVEHHFQEKHRINFTSKKINTKNFRAQLELMKNAYQETNDSKFSCKLCLFKTDNESEFNRHLLEHKPLKPISYICKRCQISFAMKSCLSEHLQKRHGVSNTDAYLKETGQMMNRKESPAMKENQCRVCYKEFATNLELNTHFRMHGMAFLMNKTRFA